jgi:hypothetical protein
MEYLAGHEGRVGDTILLQIHPEVLQWEGVRFTAGVSNKSGVLTHSMEEAKFIIDFEVLNTRTNWSDAEIKRRFNWRKNARFLFPVRIPLELIRNNWTNTSASRILSSTRIDQLIARPVPARCS